MSALMTAGRPAGQCERLEQVFADCFEARERTVLIGGASEPLYQPATDPHELNRLYYREDYFASGLHEAAHWCIAGRERRRQVDFGYWYAPEGRSPSQQRAFEAVEVMPQALEWLFASACGVPFRVSVDNLDPDSGAVPDTGSFRAKVLARALVFRDSGLPPRAERLFAALATAFGTGLTPDRVVLEAAALK